MSLIGFHSLPSEQPKLGWLHYYGGVGQASTIPLFVLPIAILWSARRETRVLGVLGLICALAIGFATLNRFFYVSAACVLVVGYWPVLRRHWARAMGAAAVLGACAVLMIVYSSRERAPPVAITAEHGMSIAPTLQTIVSQDTRPLIWRFYLDKVKDRPLLGIGFGKRLPKRTYSAQAPQWLTTAEPQATTHAHNLFLNTVLQVGIIGLVLQCALFSMMFRATLSAGGNVWIMCAGLALLVGLITKNQTDDLMWQSTMLAFWANFGWLLGRARPDRSQAPTAPSSRAGC
ncbi:O-antigen ligase family protein [Robbsia sp. KACC 23696]|uniref:O-antigen ligase family protein n=1 Tax=Robbsia sp. KACC 23696 TaxID=3149231 RepID=UPI00325C2328